MSLVVHNALHAVDGASTVFEGLAGVISLSGADERHAALSFVIASLPAHADVYACMSAATDLSGALDALRTHARHAIAPMHVKGAA